MCTAFTEAFDMDGDIDDLKKWYKSATHIANRKRQEKINVEKHLNEVAAENFVRYKMWKLLKKAAKKGEPSITIHESDKIFRKMPIGVLIEIKKIMDKCWFTTTYTERKSRRTTSGYKIKPASICISGWEK